MKKQTLIPSLKNNKIYQYQRLLSLTVASLSVTRMTKGSKLRILTTWWGRRSKIALKTPPEISRRIFWCNKKFWKWKFEHPIKPEIDRKWAHAIVQLTIWNIANTHMLMFEFLCDWYCYNSGLVSLLTEKSSSIESKKAQLLTSRWQKIS